MKDKPKNKEDINMINDIMNVIMVIAFAVLTAGGMAILLSNPVWVMEVIGFAYYAVAVTVFGVLLISWFSCCSLVCIDDETNDME